MEKERLGREKEEKEKAERAKKLKEEFGDTNNQWEKDKSEIQKLVKQDKVKDAESRPQGQAQGKAQGQARGGGGDGGVKKQQQA